MRSKKLFLIGALCFPLTACDGTLSSATSEGIESGSQSGPQSIPAEVRAEMESPNEPNDPANSGYYRLRVNDAGCENGQCGYLARRVNRLATTCVDGVVRFECPIVGIDGSQLKLDEQSTAELRGQPQKFLLRGSIDGQSLFRVSEAWRGHDGIVATGTYLRAKLSGIECITYPCPAYQVARLNSDLEPKNVSSVRFDGVGTSGEDAQKLLSTPEGVLIAAELSTVTGPAGTAPALDATEYYLPFGR